MQQFRRQQRLCPLKVQTHHFTYLLTLCRIHNKTLRCGVTRCHDADIVYLGLLESGAVGDVITLIMNVCMYACTSDFLSLARLEMSYTSSTAAVCSPPVPRGCSCKFFTISSNRGSYTQTTLRQTHRLSYRLTRADGHHQCDVAVQSYRRDTTYNVGACIYTAAHGGLGMQTANVGRFLQYMFFHAIR